MKFEKRLKKSCSNCKISTIKVYLSGTRRLLRLTDEKAKDIPDTSAWLMNKTLLDKVKKLPLSKRRHLSAIGFIASKAYGLKADNHWNTQMLADIASYQGERDKNKKSEYEKKNLPSDISEIKNAATLFKKQIARTYAKLKPTLADLYKVQKWLILRLSYVLPFRNDLPSINVNKQTPSDNYMAAVGKGFKIVMNKFKASEKVGEKVIKLKRPEVVVLKKFLKYRLAAGVDHDFLLTGRNGKPMTKKGYSQLLPKLTESLLGKRVGSRILRVLYATSNKEILDKAQEISDIMLHGKTKQTRQYTRKK